jgi:hypothetical protein
VSFFAFAVSTAFLVVSTVLTVVSFLVVESTTVLDESVVEVVEEPLQAAKETATANAKEAILIEFFMCVIFCFVALILQPEKGNPSFFKYFIFYLSG